MAKKRKKIDLKPNMNKRSVGNAFFVSSADFDNLCCTDYVSLDRNPEIMTAVKKIAELIGSMTIYLMANTSKGDVRIKNALSRKIDIEPNLTMTRKHWMEIIVMNMLLYGRGNSIVIPHTYKGNIQNLEPVSASRVQFMPYGDNPYRKYRILIDGVARKPEDVLHFVYNPDEYYVWKGKGLNVVLKDIAGNLKQARTTQRAFMESKWKPSVIVRVDALIDEFSSPEGRQQILDSYVKSAEVGEPWLVPSEAFEVEQVKPLSLKDLAIDSSMDLDKRTIAAILGVPPYLLGVGAFNRDEWNNFIQNTVGLIAKTIEQEMTNKIILNDDWYLKFNMLSLYDYDIKTIFDVFGGLADKGMMTPNEVRDRLGLSRLDGLDELRILENYLPVDQIGQQKKVSGNE